MSAYLVIDSDWKDTSDEARAAYVQTAQPAIFKYQGRFLTPPGRGNESLEGDWHPQRLTIIEFPDIDTARTLWTSDEFRAAVAARKRTNAVFKVVLIDGAPT